MSWRRAVLSIVGCIVALAAAPAAGGAPSRYCERPDGPGAFLAASRGVTCTAAETVKKALETSCYQHTRCIVDGFRCTPFWDGRFDRPFTYTHHALCVDGWRWIVWDGG